VKVTHRTESFLSFLLLSQKYYQQRTDIKYAHTQITISPPSPSVALQVPGAKDG
uniref:Uncharacterized protein n=1 Tax=Varanus komodoensis TaxID=61221 RepID=A0A8D2LJ12_VARKO